MQGSQVWPLHNFSLTQQLHSAMYVDSCLHQCEQKSWKDPFHNGTEGEITPRWEKKNPVFNIYRFTWPSRWIYSLLSSLMTEYGNRSSIWPARTPTAPLSLHLNHDCHSLQLPPWLLNDGQLLSLLLRMQPDYISSQPEFLALILKVGIFFFYFLNFLSFFPNLWIASVCFKVLTSKLYWQS